MKSFQPHQNREAAACLMEPEIPPRGGNPIQASGPRAGVGTKPLLAGRQPNARVLVAIANHGTKNRHFLDRLLGEYRSMQRHDVDIVVLSDIPKDLGPDVEVRVGLPIEDPWSLPFGHKELFAERVEEYDLFIYTEDDTLITESNIEAFVEETRMLPDELIVGFMRYELAPDGQKFYSSMHSHYHWDPRSVLRVGNSLFAYHTNEHAACFILTRQHLRMAIASGGFLLPPRKERYDMLVTAATDPYTRCGMRKMICISRLDDFCLHHLPNVYCGKLGLDAGLAKREIARLTSLAEHGNVEATGSLFEPFPLRDGDRWNKNFYEGCRRDVLKCVPREANRVLSVGCGCGTTEAELVRRGIEVVGIPLDSIIRTTAESMGITMLAPDFELAAKQLAGQRFDCILMLDILQQLPDPVAIIRLYHGFLRNGGTMVVSLPNWNYHRTLRQRLTSQGRKSLECRARSLSGGVQRTTKARAAKWLRQGGLSRIEHCWVAGGRLEQISKWTLGIADELLCRNLLISARC